MPLCSDSENLMNTSPVLTFYPPENVRKPIAFWRFQGEVKRQHWRDPHIVFIVWFIHIFSLHLTNVTINWWITSFYDDGLDDDTSHLYGVALIICSNPWRSNIQQDFLWIYWLIFENTFFSMWHPGNCFWTLTKQNVKCFKHAQATNRKHLKNFLFHKVYFWKIAVACKGLSPNLAFNID